MQRASKLENDQMSLDDLQQYWLFGFPAGFESFDFEKVESGQRTKVESVLKWKYGVKGLLLNGTPRKWKTRSATEALRRQVLEGRGKIKFKWIDSFDFGSLCLEAYRNGHERDFIEKFCVPEILFIDDLGKFKITVRVAEALFAITDRRMRFKKPMIITTNSTGETLLKRFEDLELGQALIARLRYTCETISFV